MLPAAAQASAALAILAASVSFELISPRIALIAGSIVVRSMLPPNTGDMDACMGLAVKGCMALKFMFLLGYSPFAVSLKSHLGQGPTFCRDEPGRVILYSVDPIGDPHHHSS